MDINLGWKIAIVTGGSSGIGLACAKMLIVEGVSVVIAAHEGVDNAAVANWSWSYYLPKVPFGAG